jgi:hypothetical protein
MREQARIALEATEIAAAMIAKLREMTDKSGPRFDTIGDAHLGAGLAVTRLMELLNELERSEQLAK